MTFFKTIFFLAALATASNAQTVTTTARTTGMFGTLARYPFDAMRQVANLTANIKKDAVNFGLGATNQMATGIIDAKKSMAGAMSSVASGGANFATGAVSNMAGSFAGMMPSNTMLGALASTGAKMVDAGSKMTNMGLQTAISTANAAEMMKLNAIKGGIAAGTSLAGTGINAGIGLGHGMVDTGLNMGGSLAGMAGSALDVGLDVAHGVVQTVGELSDRVGAVANDIAQGSRGQMQGTVAQLNAQLGL